MSLNNVTQSFVKCLGKAEKLHTAPKVSHNFFTPPKPNADCFIKETISKIKPMPEGKSVIWTNDGEMIGTVHYSIGDNILGKNWLPESWFKIKPDGSKELKPFLWLETIIIDSEKRGNGYGKEAMKRLYQESVERGCGGRMLCYSAWGSHDFYGKCGWEVFGNIEWLISRENRLISKYQAEIDKLKLDPSKVSELNLNIKLLENAQLNLEKIKKGLPYTEGTIMFNPTPENINKLFS